MAITSVMGSVENTVSVIPATILILTTDSLAQAMVTGYLNGQTGVTFNNSQLALIQVVEGLIWLQVSIVGADTSLIYPLIGSPTLKQLVTTPPGSQSSSLALGTVFQNNFGYDIMLTVYVNVTAALSASFLLGVGSTNAPTQQSIISGLTLSVLGVIPVNIYLPNKYYAKLSTSGTITATISGQIAMPI